MTTLLPAYAVEDCPICVPALERVFATVQRRFPGSDTHPGQMTRRAANVLWTAAYYQGILHHNGHPTDLIVYGQSLKNNQVRVSQMGGCVSCQSEKESASSRLSIAYLDRFATPEWLPPQLIAHFCKLMHRLGVLHELEHPVSLPDYDLFLKTGDT